MALLEVGVQADDPIIIKAIDYLKSQVSGRSTFVPIELRCEDADMSIISGEGVIGPLVEHVSYTNDYKKIVNYLFKDVILVSDIRKALDIWANGSCRSTLVTLDGEVIDPVGAVTGGSGGDTSGQLMAHRREIKELIIEVNALTFQLNIEEEIAKPNKEEFLKRGMHKKASPKNYMSALTKWRYYNRKETVHEENKEINKLEQNQMEVKEYFY